MKLNKENSYLLRRRIISKNVLAKNSIKKIEEKNLELMTKFEE